MHQRNYRFYIDKAKANQGFKYDKEVDMALGFKSSMTAMITKEGSTKHLSEEKMMQLAALAGESDILALMDLHIMKAENDDAKKAYTKILQKITAAVIAALGINALTSSHALAFSGVIVATPSLTSVAPVVCFCILWKMIYTIILRNLAVS